MGKSHKKLASVLLLGGHFRDKRGREERGTLSLLMFVTRTVTMNDKHHDGPHDRQKMWCRSSFALLQCFFKYKPKVFLKNAMLMIGRVRETTRISILSQRKTTSCCMLLKWIGWRKIMTLWSSKYKISEIKSFEPNPLTCRTRKILVRLKHTRIPSSAKELNP